MLLRKTESVCPKCLEPIDASLVEKDGSLYMQKTCSEHGSFEILLSTSADDYRELDNYYFSLNRIDTTVPEYELWPTYRCNIDCTICRFGGQNHEMQYHEPSCRDIEKFISNPK